MMSNYGQLPGNFSDFDQQVETSAAPDDIVVANMRENKTTYAPKFSNDGNDLSYAKLPYPDGDQMFHKTSPTLRSTNLSPNDQEVSKAKPQNKITYKTNLCANWASNRTCRFGTRCWYAHGVEELQPPARTTSDSLRFHLSEPPITYEATDAQKNWILMSNTAAASYEMQPIIDHDFNRFARESVSAQLRAGVESRLRGDMFGRNCYHSFRVSGTRPQSPMPFAVDTSKKDELSAEASMLLSSLSFLRPEIEEQSKHETCDIFAISGFCPMGDKCFMEHKLYDSE